MRNKILTLLGFAQKSGNLLSGENTCELFIKKNKIKLIIISEEASDNSRNKFMSLCAAKGIPVINFGTKLELSSAIGKHNRAIIGIKDQNFTKKILSLYKDEK